MMLCAGDSRAERTFAWLESLLQDTRYALRTLRRAPLFSCGIAATVGLGIGLICSLFTVFEAYVSLDRSPSVYQSCPPQPAGSSNS
jgi:hypothetical protein